MITSIDTDRAFLITSGTRSSLEKDLNAAEDAARTHAMREGMHGILVTRHQPTTYVLTISSEVPYGLTQERTQCEAFGDVCSYCSSPELN